MPQDSFDIPPYQYTCCSFIVSLTYPLSCSINNERVTAATEGENGLIGIRVLTSSWQSGFEPRAGPLERFGRQTFSTSAPPPSSTCTSSLLSTNHAERDHQHPGIILQTLYTFKPALMMTRIAGGAGWLQWFHDPFRGALKRDVQAGNQVGQSFWSMLLAEHGLDDAGV